MEPVGWTMMQTQTQMQMQMQRALQLRDGRGRTARPRIQSQRSNSPGLASRLLSRTRTLVPSVRNSIGTPAQETVGDRNLGVITTGKRFGEGD